jgi:hypothetical protein
MHSGLLITPINSGQGKLLDDSLLVSTGAPLLALILCVLMLLFIYLGRKIGLRRKKDEGETTASSTTLSAMLGLLAFLLAFTFGMSSTRFDARKKNFTDEANAIGTAIRRADMYTGTYRTAFRNAFKKYLDARILYYEAKTNLDLVDQSRMVADAYGKRLWTLATDLSRDPAYESATRQMIPALNEMFDIRTSRLVGELARVPASIVWMLFILAWVNAFYVGYSSAAKGTLDWVPALGFCILTAVVVYITLDLDRPRRGFIQLNSSEKAMLELKDLFDDE